jgi:hypothetical protein
VQLHEAPSVRSEVGVGYAGSALGVHQRPALGFDVRATEHGERLPEREDATRGLVKKESAKDR